MIPAQPFNAEHPYWLSEDDHTRLYRARHLLALVADLADGPPNSTVTVSREALAVFAGVMAEQLEQV